MVTPDPASPDDRADRASRMLRAAAAGDEPEVRRLLRDDPRLADAGDAWAKTPLHHAAERDHQAVAQALLEAGASVDCQTTWGMTPLEWAATMNSRRVADLLLQRQSPSNLYVAAGLGMTDLAREFFFDDGSLQPNAGRRGYRETSPGQYQKSPPPTDRTLIISDALQIAGRNGHIDVVRLLHERGADINFRGFFGAPALHWACMNGHIETARFLLDHHADRFLRDEQFGSDALGWAVEGKHHELVALLESRGMRLTLAQHIILDHFDRVREMLEREPALLDRRRTADWGAPLHEAIVHGRARLVAWLLERGADVSAKNIDGDDALTLARKACEGRTRPANLPEHPAILASLERHARTHRG